MSDSVAPMMAMIQDPPTDGQPISTILARGKYGKKTDGLGSSHELYQKNFRYGSVNRRNHFLRSNKKLTMSLLIATAAAKADHLIECLNASANTPYIGEPISQLEHSLQCAYQAAQSNPPADEETIIAALLHDIGQFVSPDDLKSVLGSRGAVRDMVEGGGSISGSVGRVGHEELGAQYLLALGFSQKVARLVGSHVEAKRYLCAVDPEYHDSLSEASKKSLIFQGGPMSGEEKARMDADAWRDEICRLRKWDDGAKIVDLKVPDAKAYRQLMMDILVS